MLHHFQEKTWCACFETFSAGICLYPASELRSASWKKHLCCAWVSNMTLWWATAFIHYKQSHLAQVIILLHLVWSLLYPINSSDILFHGTLSACQDIFLLASLSFYIHWIFQSLQSPLTRLFKTCPVNFDRLFFLIIVTCYNVTIKRKIRWGLNPSNRKMSEKSV